MIGFTIAISEFVGLLMSSMLWIAAEVAGEVAIGIGIIGGGVLLIRHLRSRHRSS